MNKYTEHSIKGITAAVLVIGLWFISLLFLLTRDMGSLQWYLIIPGILWQTFLYTGLFITAHDAMHGTVFPSNRKVNTFVGSLAVKLYALFSYPHLLKEHWEHHKHPASSEDPDFHDGKHPQFYRWYLHFMKNYVTWKQILGMAIAFNIMLYLFHLPVENLIVFWILPSLLSTVQLFYFGTYLPHRRLKEDYPDKHHARSNNYSALLSFLTCYHFGYHWEHHEYPYIPWWRLPGIRKLTLAKTEEIAG